MLSRRGSGDRPGGPPPAGRWTTAPGSEARTDREEEPAMRSGRILIALVIAAIGGLFYFCRTEVNPVTGEKQRVAMSVEQETALGLQTAPQMAAELGGLHPDPTLQNYVEQLGERIVAQSAARGSTYQYDFHLLADPETVNAFALPGGQIFITAALLRRLQDEAQLAGVLGHEIAHVVGLHSAQHLAKAQLTQILARPAGVPGSSEDSHRGDADPRRGERRIGATRVPEHPPGSGKPAGRDRSRDPAALPERPAGLALARRCLAIRGGEVEALGYRAE